MNSPNVPEWMGKSPRKVYCDPPDLNFRVYQAPVEENEESGGCAPVLLGGIALCVACIFGMSRESSAGVGQSIVTESIVQSKTDLLSTFISTHFKSIPSKSGGKLFLLKY